MEPEVKQPATPKTNSISFLPLKPVTAPPPTWIGDCNDIDKILESREREREQQAKINGTK